MIMDSRRQPEPAATPSPASAPRRRTLTAAQWHEVFDASLVYSCVLTPAGKVLEINRAALATVGLQPEELLGRPLWGSYPLAHSSEVQERVRGAVERAARGESVREELLARVAGGRLMRVATSFAPFHDAAGRVAGISVCGVDVTERRRAERATRVLNRALHMLSECSVHLVHARSESELLANICRTIVATGGYRFAWVGVPEHDAARSVRVLASEGVDPGYFEACQISWADGPYGGGPTGRALRERVAVLCRDTDTDPAYAPWRARAAESGFRSSLAVPVFTAGAVLAVLNVYSTDSTAFTEQELELLRKLADELGYGLEALRAQQSHGKAQQQLQLFRRLLDHSNDLLYVADTLSGRILDANESLARRLGYTREELLGLTLPEFATPLGHAPQWQERIAQAGAPASLVVESTYRCKDGQSFPAEVSLSFVEDERTPLLIAVVRDISERRRQERRIAHLTRVLRMQNSIASAVLRVQDREELLQEACRVAVEVGAYDRAVLSMLEAGGARAPVRYEAGCTEFMQVPPFEIGDGTEPDRSVTARALRTGEMVASNDLSSLSVPVFARRELLELGFRSIVALPLTVEGARVGALTLLSRDEELVQDEELRLLQDIAATLQFGLRSQQHADAARFLTYYDPLSGLPKRALFCERLDALLRTRFNPAEHPTVTAFDVQQLSSINDSFGRNFGDLLLQQVAERLKRYADSDQHVGYLGGGSFVLLRPELASPAEGAGAVIDRALFAEPFAIEGRSIRVSCKAGVARCPTDGTDAATLVQKAEAALRHAKESGEQYLHYVLQMHSEVAERLSLESRLRVAIDERQFVLHYQPQVNIATGRIEALEALLRWQEPGRELQPPASFLEVLESSGLIVAAGEWVIEQAVHDCREWRRLGFGALRVAVNVSAHQIQQRSFVERFLEIVRDRRTPGCGLDIEITESSLLQDLDGTSRKLRELRAAGARIAIDDFGTGYSSLGLLSRLPVDVLKIDRSFISGLPHDAASVTLTSSIIQLASAFNLITVAEGVESQEQLALLRGLKCSQSQGYLHSQPLPAQAITALLRRAGGLPNAARTMAHSL
jgi:PAS domain S-box-containing protein/diguanylate cyclase (GGDEF)-like protein